MRSIRSTGAACDHIRDREPRTPVYVAVSFRPVSTGPEDQVKPNDAVMEQRSLLI